MASDSPGREGVVSRSTRSRMKKHPTGEDMLHLSQAARLQLEAYTDECIGKALAGCSGFPAPLSKIEALGATLSTALPAAADAWSHVVARARAAVHLVGAFSFGVPSIEFLAADGAPQRCALADAMIVVDNLMGPVPERRAILLTADIAEGIDNPQVKTQPGRAELYANWPPFRLINSRYSPQVRTLNETGGGTLRGGCRRHVIYDLRNCTTFCSAPSSDQASDDLGPRTFGSVLVGLAVGAEGWCAVPGGDDDWSVTIDDLLVATRGSTVAGLTPGRADARTAQTYGGEHGTGYVLFLNQTDQPIEEAIVNGYIDDRLTGEREGPLSVVHIIFQGLHAEARPPRDGLVN